MSVAMPAPDEAVLARRERIVAALRAIVPGEGVIAAEREMRPYETDGLTASLAILLFSSRCSSIKSAGTPPSVPSGITGS